MRVAIAIAVLSAVVVAANAQTEWQSSVDPIDDTIAFSRLGTYLDGAGQPVLVFRANRTIAEFFIAWDRYLTSEPTAKVTIRLDKQDPIALLWNLSRDHTATFVPMQGFQAAALYVLMTYASQVAVRVEIPDSRSYTAIFDVSELSSVAAPFRQQYQWFDKIAVDSESQLKAEWERQKQLPQVNSDSGASP